MYFLTGAETSLAKSNVAVQNDPAKSLGGYISSSVVPNGALNALFDIVSMETLKLRNKETIAIGLINKLPTSVTDIQLRFVCNKEDQCAFKVAAVAIGEDYAMEQIPNRYSEPMSAEFHDATFNRASVELEIISAAEVGETISFSPFGVELEITESGSIEQTIIAIENAFEESEEYAAMKVRDNVIRIVRRDETVVGEPIKCSFESDGTFDANFLGDLKNGSTNFVTLIEDGTEFKSGQAIGLWIQRIVKPNKYRSNETLIEDYKKGTILNQTEEVVLATSYKLYEKPQEEEPIPEEPVKEEENENGEIVS